MRVPNAKSVLDLIRSTQGGESDAAIVEDEGVSPARVSFDHSDDKGDIDYFLALVKRGYSHSMDHVHRGLIADFKPSFERRGECIKLLVDAGYADKVFLSQDTGFGVHHPQTHPRLKEICVSSEQVRVITVENPKHFFAQARAAA